MQRAASFDNTPLTEEEIRGYVDWWNSSDMTAQGKREWLERLSRTIAGLHDVHARLSVADAPCAPPPAYPARREVQVTWKREPNARFTVDHLDRAVGGSRVAFGYVTPAPTIMAVKMEDGYVLDARKRLRRELMCFAELSSEAEAEALLERGGATVRYEVTAGCYTSIDVKFVRPPSTPAQRAALLNIGSLIARLGEITHEFHEIGVASFANGAPIIPRLGKRMVARDEYANALERYESVLAGGGVMGATAYAFLLEKTPVDTEAVERRIAALYREHFGILVKLRRFQIEGHDFIFDIPRVAE